MAPKILVHFKADIYVILQIPYMLLRSDLPLRSENIPRVEILRHKGFCFRNARPFQKKESGMVVERSTHMLFGINIFA